MEKYETPVMEVIEFETEDVITTSGDDDITMPEIQVRELSCTMGGGSQCFRLFSQGDVENEEKNGDIRVQCIVCFDFAAACCSSEYEYQ